MLECKSAAGYRKLSRLHGGGVVNKPDVVQAAKVAPLFGGDYSAILALVDGNNIETLNELKRRKITAFTVATLLHIETNALKIRTVLDEPGFATEKVADQVWEGHDGRMKRIPKSSPRPRTMKAGWPTILRRYGDCATPLSNCQLSA